MHEARRWRINLIVAVAGVVVSIIAVIVGIWIRDITFSIRDIKTTVFVVGSDIAQMEDEVQRLATSVVARELVITHPATAGSVNLFDQVRGKTPFPDMNHYVVVTPLKTGVDWIDDAPMIVSSSGSWSGRAKFGEAAAGAGEQFLVRILATKSTLSPGPLVEVPEDAVFSEAIDVTRKQ